MRKKKLLGRAAVLASAAFVVGVVVGATVISVKLGTTPSEITAGDILSAAGSLLGTFFAVLGALWVEGRRRHLFEQRNSDFLANALRAIKDDFENATRVNANSNAIALNASFVQLLLESHTRVIATARSLLSEAKSRLQTDDFQHLDIVRRVERKLVNAEDATGQATAQINERIGDKKLREIASVAEVNRNGISAVVDDSLSILAED